LAKYDNSAGFGCGPDQIAGGAGCGQPPTHKACRKINFAGSRRPLTQQRHAYIFCGPCSFDGRTRQIPHTCARALAFLSAANSFD